MSHLRPHIALLLILLAVGALVMGEAPRTPASPPDLEGSIAALHVSPRGGARVLVSTPSLTDEGLRHDLAWVRWPRRAQLCQPAGACQRVAPQALRVGMRVQVWRAARAVVWR